MKANVMDSRTGEPLEVGDVVYSLERGDSLRIEAVEVEEGALGERVRVRLLPFGSAFTAYASDDDELGSPVLAGYWKE